MTDPFVVRVDAPGDPEPLAAEPKARASRKRTDPIITLTGFFRKRTASPTTFLKDLREAERWGFDAEDIEGALEEHAQSDKDFGRTVRLIAVAQKDREGRFAAPIVRFGELALRRRLAENPYAIGVDLDAAVGPEGVLDTTVRVLTPRLGDSGRRGESANVLLGTILCLSHAQGLSAETAIDALVSALASDSAQSASALRAKIVWLGERPKDIRRAVDLLAPSVVRARNLGREVESLQSRLDAEGEARRSADDKVEALASALSELETALGDAKTEIERLEETSRAAGVHADHDVKRIKARVAGLLDGQLRDLITTVDEALSVDPPQVDVAREKVGVVVRELERQVEWLRS
jgi:hypothetical protein